MISGGFGAPDAAASALTIRVIAARTRVRTSASNVRTFSLMTASSGMTFSLSPACSAPTVTTAASEAASSRDTMVCSRSTVAAAITTGSMLAWGIDPCAPRPNIRICRLSAADVITPARLPIDPAGPTITCWPKNHVGFWETGRQSGIDHGLGAPACFLGRLEHQHQRPFPRISRVRQESWPRP